MTAATPLLQIRGLTFGWPGQPLLHDLNIDIRPGLTAVSGDESRGKTTLLRLLAGELEPQSGHVTWAGAPLEGGPQRVFWIHPQTEAHDRVSAADWFSTLPERAPRFSRQTLDDCIDGFGLAPHLTKPMYMLSTGSKRKVWLSAAFAAGAPLTLIDQPFAALDGPAIRFLRERLQEAAMSPDRAWVIADFEAPAQVPLAAEIAL